MRNEFDRIDRFRSFETLFSNTLESLEPILSDNMKVYISPTLTRKDEIEVNKHESLLFVSQLFGAKSIYFLVKRHIKRLDAEVSRSFDPETLKYQVDIWRGIVCLMGR